MIFVIKPFSRIVLRLVNATCNEMVIRLLKNDDDIYGWVRDLGNKLI